MKKRDAQLCQRLAAGIQKHERGRRVPGIARPAERDCLIEQLIESVRRVQYPAAIRKRDICAARADPSSDVFDPIRAAILYAKKGDLDEAFWLVFLFVQFGKSSTSGYRLLCDVYAGQGSGGLWTWKRVSSELPVFKKWITDKIKTWKIDDIHRGYGAHRGREKRESIEKAVETYVAWVSPPRSHAQLVQDASNQSGKDRGKTFDYLYRSMCVYRFGRLAKFDYLAMLGKLGLADIEPPSTYILEGTGPLTGARLLYTGDEEDKSHDQCLDDWLVQFGSDLGVGQQVVEDAICNWQKSPAKFKMFRG